MKWNSEKGFATYQSAMNNIQVLLGVRNLGLTGREELVPYYTYILTYIVEKLIQLGNEAEIKTRIQEIFDIYSWGTDKIISGQTLDISWALGIDTTDYTVEGSDIPYNQEYLVFSWAEVLTQLSDILKIQYSHLLCQKEDTCCFSCDSCTPGMSTADLERWTSGVYPEDEEYIPSTINSSWRVNSDITSCTKCGRK